jgi:hypothetical protein
MDIVDLLQWPAMVITVIAAWLVGSASRASAPSASGASSRATCLWVVWGLHDHAYALVALQFFLAAINARGSTRTSEARRPRRTPAGRRGSCAAR